MWSVRTRVSDDIITRVPCITRVQSITWQQWRVSAGLRGKQPFKQVDKQYLNFSNFIKTKKIIFLLISWCIDGAVSVEEQHQWGHHLGQWRILTRVFWIGSGVSQSFCYHIHCSAIKLFVYCKNYHLASQQKWLSSWLLRSYSPACLRPSDIHASSLCWSPILSQKILSKASIIQL